MAVYRQAKVPTVEAVEWTGENLPEVIELVRAGLERAEAGVPPQLEQNIALAMQRIRVGDFVVQQGGSFVPVNGAEFRQRYVKVTVVDAVETVTG